MDVLTGVMLDPLNVRLGYPEGAPQDEIIYDLFKNEDALDIVESIAKVGLLEHEFPIVLQRNSDLVVVEGNRRIAALKAIQNPLLIPDFHAKITSLTSLINDRAELRKIQVRQAPTQEDADQLIAALHTGKPRRPWTAPRRAEFFQAKVDEGKGLQDLIDDYPTVDVLEYVKVAQLIRCFKSASFEDEDLRSYLASRNFPINVFARLFENAEFLTLMRIEIDPATSVARPVGALDRFSCLTEKVIGDIKTKRINTRSLNKRDSPTYQIYMDELRDMASTLADDDVEKDTSFGRGEDDKQVSANLSIRRNDNGLRDTNSTESTPGGHSELGKIGPDAWSDNAPDADSRNHLSGAEDPGSVISPSDLTSHGPKDSPASDTGETSPGDGLPTPKRRRLQPINLRTEGLTVPLIFPDAMHQTYDELCKINYRNFPTATMDLLRTVLEKTIKAYAEANNQIIRAELQKRGKTVSGKFEQLGDCLLYLELTLTESGNSKLVQVLKKIKSTKPAAWTVSATHLNAMNHNHHISATPTDVEEMWSQMSSLVRFMLAS